MKQLEYYYSDDYAGVHSGKYEFYYGYEHEDENCEWCFIVKEQGNIVFNCNTSTIEKKYRNDLRLFNTPVDYLIAGIGIFLLNNI